MSTQTPFHHHLLRPAIIHILRAAGFHSTRPSVLDILTDLAARYLSLLAQRTATIVYERNASAQIDLDDDALIDIATHDMQQIPTLRDIRLAMQSCHVFAASSTASEEIWTEMLRKPLDALPSVAAREKEKRRRDDADTRDVQEFIDWVTGGVNEEIRRIAGLLDESTTSTALATTTGTAAAAAATAVTAATSGVVPAELLDERKEDYLALLRKKRSKTGEGSRFAGTALGTINTTEEARGPIKIEGGPDSLAAWQMTIKKRRVENVENGGGTEEGGRKRMAVT